MRQTEEDQKALDLGLSVNLAIALRKPEVKGLTTPVYNTNDTVLDIHGKRVGVIFMSPNTVVKNDKGECLYGISFNTTEGRQIQYVAQETVENDDDYALVKSHKRR